ncbi:MAG: hypothetical protein LV473_06560 [Nitrospira sp.]|nr:hypothetical protein [Nitrospira sp.]
MNVTSNPLRGFGYLVVQVLRPAIFVLLAIGCARLPVPVQVIYEDQSLLIRTERVASKEEYSHPLSLTADDMAKILSGVSVQERPASWPLRLFGKVTKPERLFREDEIRALAPYLADGLRTAKPNERVTFGLYTPGPNPTYERYVTSGWIAVRDPFLHIALDYVRNLQPRSPTRSYYPFYPEMPSAPPPSDVFFEPQEFWRADPTDGNSAIQFRDYLRTAAPQDEGG